jgi:hypothetical protein
MRKGIIVIAMAGLAGTAWAITYGAKDAYAGATNSPTIIFTPQQLTAAHHLTYAERAKTTTDNGTWYTWNEGVNTNYDFMMFIFADANPSSATLNWQVGIDYENAHVQCFYWHGFQEKWVWLDDNEPPGGWNPNTEHVNAMPAFQNNGGENVVFLFVGPTFEYGDSIRCDVANIDAN